MIAYCGLNCEQCEAYLATKANDDALRTQVAEKWARLYNSAIKPEHINCRGCRSSGPKTYYCEQLCAVRKCASARAVTTCADCAEYPCGTLGDFFRAAPSAKVTLDALRGR